MPSLLQLSGDYFMLAKCQVDTMSSHQKRLFKRELSFQKKKKLARPIILPEAEVLQLERQGPELQIFLQLSKLACLLRLPRK
jgi:hypothetical protein